MKYFVSVIECNSFTEAAEQNYVSQSAISQQIRALENELNVELIHREIRHFSMTPSGEYFYRHCKDILQEVEELRKETVRLGQDEELQLNIGYLSCYSGQELHQAIAEFTQTYPEVKINIVNGTHEELYNLLRFKDVDLVLTDQRRAFSNEYVNFVLMQSDCYIEISSYHKCGGQETVTVEDLRGTSCILITSKEQQNVEQDYYQNTLGYGGQFIFAESLEEGRLMAIGNRGFLPVENVGTLPSPLPTLKRLPLLKGGKRVKRNYCAFWKKERSSYYIEEFAKMFNRLLFKGK